MIRRCSRSRVSSEIKTLLGIWKIQNPLNASNLPRFFSSSPSRSIVVKRRDVTETIQFDPYVPKRNENKIYKDLKRANKRTKKDTVDQTSKDNIRHLEIQDALKGHGKINLETIENSPSLIDAFLFSKNRPCVTIPSVEIIYQTSEGDGIGFIPKSLYAAPYVEEDEELYDRFTVVIVPKTVVGDKVKVELVRHYKYYAEGVLRQVLPAKSRSGPRKDELIVCGHFHDCSGCQLQMLTYEDQLQFKQSVIHKAYRFFHPELLESVDISRFGVVNGSPLQYAYRTKITPHLVHPRNDVDIPNIGFKHVEVRKGMVDVESCKIATKILNLGYKHKKEQILNKGPGKDQAGRMESLFFRESLRVDKDTGNANRVCISNNKLVITEKIGDFVFQFDANSFFQNNNVILPDVLDYIRHHMSFNPEKFKYLVDTYCGTGFFGISLSKDIHKDGKIFGIELSPSAVEDATHNAKLNGLEVPSKVQIVEGQADSMFSNSAFRNAGMTGDKSVVIMDPSRKGSTKLFMQQLLEFQPKLIVYVSCNVFTQARDLAYFHEICKKNNVNYRVREVMGFDFFPQTRHVETVAILELID